MTFLRILISGAAHESDSPRKLAGHICARTRRISQHQQNDDGHVQKNRVPFSNLSDLTG